MFARLLIANSVLKTEFMNTYARYSCLINILKKKKVFHDKMQTQ